MAYNPNAPANDQTLAAFPPEMREQLRAIINDAIVNAAKVQGLAPGNAQGNIPISNNTINTGLNAEKLAGKTVDYFSPTTHSHADATASSSGLLSASNFNKLAGVASGAEVNQNAFGNVKIGATLLQADAKVDTLEVVAGNNIIITPDANNDKLTIDFANNKVAAAILADTATNANNATSATNAANADKLDNLHAADFNRVNMGSVTDFNLALTQGEYAFGSANKITNSPVSAGSYGKLIVQVSDGTTHNNTNNWIWQHYEDNAGNFYRRYKANSADWSTWQLLPHVGTTVNNADTVDGAHAGNSASNVLKLDANAKVPASNLPVASQTVAGVVKQGANVSIAADGTISVGDSFGLNNNIVVTGSGEVSWQGNPSAAGGRGSVLTRVAGMGAGTYTLQTLLQGLVNRSHAHGSQGFGDSNCNCNCSTDE